jgi:hypothetical protein
MKKKYISSVIYADSFSCLVCLEQFYDLEQNVAVVLECGHTICKKCLKNILNSGRKLCPIDNRTEIKLPNANNYIENKIIQKAITLNYNLKINTKSLTKLYFYYCFECNLFLSSYCAEVHKIINHKITSISSYTNEWFDYISENITLRKTTNKIKTYLILYYFQNPNILKLKNFEIKEKFPCNKKKFTFYGETIKIKNENKKLYLILLNLLSNNNSDENYSLKKGMLIGENNQVIHGYFVIYSGIEKYIIKALGISNFEGIIFFGIMKFAAIPLYSGFFLDIGILYNGISYYFGKFLEKKIEYPRYEFEVGEQITFQENFIEVIKKNRKKNEDYPEYFEENKYFKLEDEGINKKLILTENIIKSKNLNEVEIILNNNNIIQSINFSSKNNNISISKKFPNIEMLLISDSVIHLQFYNVYLLFMENKFIFSKDYSYDKPFYGYLIIPNEEQIYEIDSMKIKNVIFKNVDNFFDSIEKILNLNLVQCKIYYQQFIPDNNFERNQSENYYEIDAFNNLIIKFKSNSSEEHKKENLKNLSIRNILPDFNECYELNIHKKKKRKNLSFCSNVNCNIL